MAWCRSCERYLTPATLTSEGVCPSCGNEVQHPPERPAARCRPVRRGHLGSAPSSAAEAAAERIPWHFWLLLGAAAVYLAWRAVQGVALLLTLPGVAVLA